MIKGTTVYPYLYSLHAGQFHDNGRHIFKVKEVVGAFEKVRYLKIISKGKDIHTDLSVDNYFIEHRHLFVFGDGQSDKDMFRYIKQRGGQSIAVFENGNRTSYERAQKNLQSHVNLLAPRDYSPGSILETEVKKALEGIANRECGMDFDLVYRLQRKQLINPDITQIVEQHLHSCGYCQEQLETKAIFD